MFDNFMTFSFKLIIRQSYGLTINLKLVMSTWRYFLADGGFLPLSGDEYLLNT